jgi:Tetracyclin repressor-like, C-terminal domain
VVRLLIDSFDQRMSAVLASEESEVPHKPGRWLRAYVRACFHADATEDRLIAALGASVTGHATLLDDLRASLDEAQASAVNDGLPPARATTIRLACDGLWLGELAGMSSIAEPLRTQLRDELIALTRLEVRH